MYTIAYKWRLSTTRYAYITSTQYRVDGSEPDYTLAQIPATGKLDDATEQIIKDIVKNMSADEYRQCFEYMVEKIANDKDGQYIKLKNWEYYYHFNTKENGDEKVFFVDATASATISNDGEVHAEVVNDRGTLKFTFQIPQGVNGRDGVDGKDGAPGVPVNDGKYLESIYKLTTTNNTPLIKLGDDWDIEGSEYQTNDYIPNGWTDRPSGITSIYKYEWVSTRKYDLVKELWGEFSEPAIMSRWGEDGKDGDGIEYIYKRTTDEINPGAPTVADWENENSDYQTNDEYVKFLEHLGWTDEPIGTEKNGYKFEWVSVRKQKDGVWQQFSTPALWSSYGKDGDDVEYIYFLNNDNEVPLFDNYDINSDDYQTEDFRPTTNGVSWTDNYQSPTYEKRFSWISSRRKRDGKWLDFTGTTLFNVYKIGGKAYVDLYTRSNTRIDHHNLPSYDGNIYYSFNSDRFYSDANLTNEITTVNGLNKTVWYTDMPADNTAKMLFKTSALIEIKNDFNEIVAIPESSWYGPYLISSNGENATNQTPYINLNDNSLPLPINEENKPHKEYLHSLVGKLLVNDVEAEITEANISTSSDKNIKINSENININKDTNELHLTFTINKDEKFTNIGIIYITLKGLYEDKEVIANTQYKIVPFYSDNAVTYKMLLNQNSVFVPDNACEILPDGGIWNTQITAHVIDDKGEDVTVGDLLYEYESNKYKSFKDNNNSEGITGTLKLIGCNNEEYIANGYELIQSLPNPLRLIYEINGKTLEIGYVDFNNMPKDGKNGISTRTIFAYCSTEEGITPNNPTGGGVDFTTNTVTYPNGDDVIWGSSIPLTGVVWLSTCEFSSDTSSGLWSTPVRLTGFKGAAGVSAYHLELTNDMDQVYTTDDNVVIKGQKVETIVSILNGNTPMYITAESITVTSVNGFKVSKENVKNDSTNTEVNITFELTGTTLTAKTINFNISVKGDDYGTTNFDFVKTFKIKNLNGAIDYDLDVSPTFIKKNKNKQYSETGITVNITKRDIATDSKTVTTLTSLTDGLSIKYYYNNDSNNLIDLKTLGDKIPVAADGYNDEVNKITINLYKQEEPIDQVFVECVSDGIDGSAYHLELSNEFDQVYTINKKILPGQTGITTTVQLFNGTQEVSISDLTVSNYDSISTTGINDNIVSISFNEGVETNKKEYIYKIYGKTPEGNDVEKDFKIIVLNGNKDYDLHSTHTYVKKYGDNIIDSSITITVLESIVGTNERTKTILNSLPEKMRIEVFVDGIKQNNIKYNSGITLNLENFNLQQKIEVNLLFDGKYIDYIAIEAIKDGKDGESPYHIELSNDMDQVLTVDGIVKYNQEINTILNLYYGSKKVETLTFDDVILPNNDNFTITGTTLNTQGDVKITIIPKIGKALEIGKNYEFPLGISDAKTNLNFNIEKIFKTVVLNTSIDYDLFVSNGVIKKTAKGYDTAKINIKIKKTDISRSDRSITYLTNLANTNLYVEIFTDNAKDPISNAAYNESGITLNISDLSPNTNILVQLYKKNDNNTNTLIDESVIEVVSDGKDGEPGADGTNIEFIYKLFKDEADFNSGNNLFPNNSSITGTTKEEVLNQLNSKIGENIPKWSDSPCGITKDYKIEVSSQRIKEPGKTNWSSWSDAFIWSKWGEDGIDGDGVEYIFQITDRGVELTNPGGDIKGVLDNYTDNTLSALTEIVNTFDFYPGKKWIDSNEKLISSIAEKYTILDKEEFKRIVNSLNKGWTDDPSDVGPYEPLEWVSIRRKKVNLDGTFEYIYSEPTIWAEWKRDTYDSLTEFMFTIYDSRVDLSQCTVTGCTWKDVKDGTVYDKVTTLSGKTALEDFRWYDSVPNHNMFTQSVWMVKGFASGEIEYTGDANESGITYSEIEWTSPTKLIDNQHMQVEYGFEVKNPETGELVVPKPINLQDIVSGLGLNYDYTELENAFRERDKNSGYDFKWTDNPTGESPTWMITSTFYNGKWSDWVVSKIKGEKGETGETGQSIQIKGSFEILEDLQNAYKYFKKQISEKPSKYFNDDKLEIGDSYIVNESIVDGEKVFGYLYVFVKDDADFEAAWESVGQIKGESSFIYIAYASSVTIDNSNIKTYHLTEGGVINNEEYYGTTPGKYIGIHVATQQYEGHPYPPKLYSEPTVADSNIDGSEKLFMWSKWEGEDGFGQEQIFILSGETAPKVPVYGENSSVTSITEWNRNDFVPDGWSDVPLTTSGSDNERCCWMATRRFPFNGEGANEFKGVSGNTGVTAILFSYYASDGNDGESPIHVELSNEMEQIYTIDNVVNVTQTASTIITVYSGGTQITDFSVNGNNATNSEYVFNKEYKEGDVITENEVKNLLVIKVNDTTITRAFKIIKLNGTKDYDLDVTPTYLRVNKNGELTYTEPISVKVTESEIGSTNVVKKTINIDDANLKVIYTYDGQVNENYFTGGTENKISVTGFSNYCKIWLVNENGVTLDYVQIEKLYDGTDGQPGASGQSPFHIELSNEFDLISVVNGRVNGDQTYTTSFELYEGDVDRTSTITSITIDNVPGKEFTKTGTGITGFTIEFNDNDILSNTIYGDLKVKTTNGKLHHKTFTIKPINDSIIHQLQVDKGYVVNGENSSINISAVTKTNSGVILMSDNIVKKIEIKEGSKTTGTTGNTYTYNYTGGSNDIVINLYINNELYDYILVEAKNDIKPSGTLNINPLSQVVYVEKIENEGETVKYKPLVSSLTFDASFVYEGVEMPVSGINISVSGSANDFSGTPVISDYGIEIKYLDYLNLTTDNLTKERYVFETKYGNDTYYNNFFITYVEPQLDVWVDGDCIYIPDDYKGGLSKEFIFEAKFENSNVTHECEIEVEGYTGITFNLRSNGWHMNIPSEIISDDDLTGFTINFTYNGISTSKEVTIIRRGKNSENWYINVFPKYLSIVNEPINLYITKNNYNGEYISLENALTQNMKLYYIIDGECVNVVENGEEKAAEEICYSDNLEHAPKEHGNNAFYPNGCLITSITTSITEDNEVKEITMTDYTQEPIYSSIEFKLYYELDDNNTKELVASEKVERFDVIRNSESARMPASGLKIDVKDLFEDYDSEKYDIVIKEIKK